MLAEQISDPDAFHAEGPVWWPDDGSSHGAALRYVDLLAGRILTLRDGATTVIQLPDNVAAFFRPRVGGGGVVAGEQQLYLSDSADFTDLRTLAHPVTDPAVRFNDGGADPSGALLAGTMRYDQTKGGAALYRVGADGAVSTIIGDATISNGLSFSPDNTLCYYNDTPTRTTWVFDWDSDTGLSNRRALFTLDEHATGGGPDGLCVDQGGNVWTAIYGGSRVECHAPDGTLVEVVEVPVSRPTSCALGGANMDELFITTTRENVPDGEEPAAGSIFSARVGVQGQPIRQFTG